MKDDFLVKVNAVYQRMIYFVIAGSVMFHVRRRPADFHPRKRKKKPSRRTDDGKDIGYRGSYDGQAEPLMIELLPGIEPDFS